MRYTGPKNRLSRKEGIDLGLKTIGSKSHANLLKRIKIIPGQHGSSRFKKLTEYGYQLRENQKLKRMYGLTAKQMKNYFDKSARKKGNTSEYLLLAIETRLDNVVFKLGFSPTRASARQLINHGHINVNKKKITIPSYAVKVGDNISFIKEKTVNIPYSAAYLDRKDTIVPVWLEKK